MTDFQAVVDNPQWAVTTGATNAISRIEATGFMFQPNGKIIVEIRNDGSVRFGEGYSPDAAAREFFESVAQAWALSCRAAKP